MAPPVLCYGTITGVISSTQNRKQPAWEYKAMLMGFKTVYYFSYVLFLSFSSVIVIIHHQAEKKTPGFPLSFLLWSDMDLMSPVKGEEYFFPFG